MTILVTGGAAFIGSNFVLDWLAQSDETVMELDPSPAALECGGHANRKVDRWRVVWLRLVYTLLPLATHSVALSSELLEN